MLDHFDLFMACWEGRKMTKEDCVAGDIVFRNTAEEGYQYHVEEAADIIKASGLENALKAIDYGESVMFHLVDNFLYDEGYFNPYMENWKVAPKAKIFFQTAKRIVASGTWTTCAEAIDQLKDAGIPLPTECSPRDDRCYTRCARCPEETDIIQSILKGAMLLVSFHLRLMGKEKRERKRSWVQCRHHRAREFKRR